MAEANEISPADLAEPIERMDEAAGSYIRGDIRHYLSLFDHPEDYTLMPPTAARRSVLTLPPRKR